MVVKCLTQPSDAEQVLSALPDRWRESKIHKGLHTQFIHQTQPEIILRLHRVCRQ